MLTSLATVLVGGTMFQRRDRSVWLGELDDIRDAALVRPEAGMALAMTSPDLGAEPPVGGGGWSEEEPVPNGRWMQKVRDAQAAERAGGQGHRVEDVAAELWSGWEPPSTPFDAPTAPPVPSAPPAPHHEAVPPPGPWPAPGDGEATDAADRRADVGFHRPADGDRFGSDAGGRRGRTERLASALVEPSPHPLRPSEMWHPGSAVLGLPGAMGPVEERVDSDSLRAPDATSATGRFARFRLGRPSDNDTEHRRGPAPVGEEADPERSRRDETSPLPAPPLPPAASRVGDARQRGYRTIEPPNRILHPATIGPAGIASPHDRSDPPVELAPAPTAATATSGAVGQAPFLVPAEPVASLAEVDPGLDCALSAPDGQARGEAIHQAIGADPATLTVSGAGEVHVVDPIVRVSEDWAGQLASTGRGVRAKIHTGSLWVSPVEGGSVSVRIDLPSATLAVEPGGCALTVVEADGSVFLVAATGPVELSRGEQRVQLKAGTMVLLPAVGDPQIDHAGPAEIEADPLVARHRELDALRR